MADDLKALQAEMAKLRAENEALSKRTTVRTEPKKENYFFVPNGVFGEKQIEIAFDRSLAKFLPSKSGKRNVMTIGVQFPNGIKGQLVLTK